MKVRNALLAILIAVSLVGSVWAQHSHHPASTEAGTGSQSPSSDDKVAACHHHMNEAKETLARLDAAVNQAQQADTPAKRQAALDQVRLLTDQLTKHISMCPMLRSEAVQDMDGMNCMGKEMQKDSTKD